MWTAKVGRFPADRRRRLTSTQPSRSSRPDSPLSLSRFTDGMRSIWAFGLFSVFRAGGAAAVLRVSGQRDLSSSSSPPL